MAKKTELKNPSRRTLCPLYTQQKQRDSTNYYCTKWQQWKALSSVSIKTVAEEMRDMDEQIALPNIRVCVVFATTGKRVHLT